MQPTHSSFADVSDQDLLGTIKRLAQRERDATAAIVAALVELDSRRLYLGEGCASLFVYCTRVLRLSEHAAHHRIEAARAARRFPIVLERLADGSVTLTNVTLLAPHLTASNHRALLDAARDKSKREVEQQVALSQDAGAAIPRGDLSPRHQIGPESRVLVRGVAMRDEVCARLPSSEVDDADRHRITIRGCTGSRDGQRGHECTFGRRASAVEEMPHAEMSYVEEECRLVGGPANGGFEDRMILAFSGTSPASISFRTIASGCFGPPPSKIPQMPMMQPASALTWSACCASAM